VLGSNNGRDTNYPDIFQRFPQSPQINVGIALRLGQERFPPNPLVFTIGWPSYYNFDIDSAVIKRIKSTLEQTLTNKQTK
jgi:hypothetical protein